MAMEESKQSEIPEQIERLEKAIACLREGLEALETRLVNVLQPKPPETKVNQPVSERHTPLGHQLQTFTGLLREMATVLDDIIARVEL